MVVYTTETGGFFRQVDILGWSTPEKFREMKEAGVVPVVQRDGSIGEVKIKYLALLKVEDDFDFVLDCRREVAEDVTAA